MLKIKDKINSFLYNDALEYYIYKIFRTIAFSISNTFVPIYLFSHLWYSIAETAIFILIVHFFVIPLIPYTYKIIKFIWVKRTISLHVLWMALFFYLLQFLSWNFLLDLPFIILLWIIKSSPKSFYSVADTIFINERILKNKDWFWKSLRVLQIATIVAWIISPLIWWILTYFYWFTNFFTITAIFTAIWIIPLFITRDFKIDFKVKYIDILDFIKNKMDKNFKLWVFWLDFSSSILQIIWPIFIIIIVQNTLDLWYLLSLSAVISIIVSNLIWNHIDKKEFSKMFKLIVNISSVLFFLRVVFPNPILLLVTDAINKISNPILEIPSEKYIYKYLHSFEDKSFVSTSYIFFFETIYLIGYSVIALYFSIIEAFWLTYNYFVFLFIFIIYWFTILFSKKLAHIK